MAVKIKTVVGQLNIVKGSWKNDAPNQVAVREPNATEGPGVGKGDLFVLTQVEGEAPNSKRVERQLAQIVCDAYYLARGSITASLRRALQAVGNQLHRRNATVEEDEKLLAGMVAVVIHKDDAFIAQVGPGALFAMMGNRVQRYPINSAWLDGNTTTDKKSFALGASQVVEPFLHHLRLRPDDMLIMVDSHLANRLPIEDVQQMIDPYNVNATVKNIGRAAQLDDCSALALSILEAEQSGMFRSRSTSLSNLFGFRRERSPSPTPSSSAPPTTTEAETPTKVSVTSPSTDLPHSSGEVVSEPLIQKLPNLLNVFSKEPEEEEKSNGNGHHHKEKSVSVKQPIQAKKSTASQMAVASPSRGSGSTPSSSTATSSATAVAEPPPRRRTRSEVRQQTDKQMARSKTETSKPLNSTAHKTDFKKRTTSSFSAGTLLRQTGIVLLTLVALLGNGLKNILLRLTPSVKSQSTRRAGGHAHQGAFPSPTTPWTILRNIAIAIPIIAAIIVLISYVQKGRLRESEYTQYLQMAQNKFQQAEAVPTDPASVLGLLNEAEAALVEAEKITVGEPEVGELRDQMAALGDRVGNVQRLYYLPHLRQYPDAGTRLKRIAVQGVEVYVLDAGNDRIFHHQLDDLGETLLPDEETALLINQNQQIDDITVGEVVDMVWMPTGGNRQTSDLVILNNTGLLEYNPTWGITPSTLANREALVRPSAVASFFGNFYVLDPRANRLMRYLPTIDGYNSPPEDYFPPDLLIDLSRAVDLAIDGSVYILYNDGRIQKFAGGRPVEFTVTGLDIPLDDPVSIFTRPDETTQYLYIADTGNRRIVQLEKDGRFVRQFKPQRNEAVSFSNLQDIFVDEIGGRFYILDNNNLYAATIPDLSQIPREIPNQTPNLEQGQEGLEPLDPSAGQTQPGTGIDQLNPNTNQTQPSYEPSNPNAGQTQPGLEQLDSSPGQTQPGIDQPQLTPGSIQSPETSDQEGDIFQ